MKYCKQRTGVALLISLAFVVLASLVLISFVSMMRVERATSQSYSSSLAAQELALGAMDQIVTDLKLEITDPAKSLKCEDPAGVGDPIYRPLDKHTLLPERVSAGNSAGADPNPNLVKVSRAQAPFFTGSTNLPAIATLVSTEAPAVNGRKVSLGAWNKARLLNNPSSFAAPDWILISRNGPQERSVSDLPALKNIHQVTNENAVVGRYAYAIYDQGGLLNINLAGYPLSAADSARSKGAAIWADLSQIPGMVNPAGLIAWRNQTSQASGSFFTTHALQAWPRNGYRAPAPGDTTFLSRGDLIRYAAANPTILAEMALPYLTTFSLDANAPSWAPELDANAGFTYKTNADVATIQIQNNYNTTIAIQNPNRNLPNVRVTVPFTRADGTQAKTGESLVNRRFPLNHLALVTRTATDATSPDIFKYFGLKRSSAASPWIYCNADGTSATAIKTLPQVAAEGREPNFFELLYAGILNGSLGRRNIIPGNSNVYDFSGVGPSDSNAYHQTIRIGANIIDQYDTDNYPTVLSFAAPNAVDPANPDPYKFYGIEDLPYPNKILQKWATARPANNAATSPLPNWCREFSVELFFEMWNPHQSLSSDTGDRPSQFRIVVNPITPAVPATYLTKTRKDSGGTAVVEPPNHGEIAATIPNTVVKFNAAKDAFREPTVVFRDEATPAGDVSILSFPSTISPTAQLPSASRPLGIKLRAPAMPGPPTNTIASLNTGFWGYELQIRDAVFSVQYWDQANNQWVTYTTFAGLEEEPATGVNKSGATYADARLLRPYNDIRNLAAFSSFVKSDPRTARFSVCQSNSDTSTDPSRWQVNNSLISSAGTVFAASYGRPMNITRMDWLAHNQAGPSYTPYYDLDRVIRGGDSCREDVATWETTSRPPMKTGVTETRPLILNRSFRTVGELGYVFRDMPWKTLDLFSGNTADAGLMDLFCLENSTVTAGRVTLNTRNETTLKALLAGVTTQESTSAVMDADTAGKVAKVIVAGNNNEALLDYGDLAARLAADTQAFPSNTKLEREAVMRALGSSTSSRTWNLLVDVVAQAGKYSPNADGLEDFVVEGERHYWLQVALDRYTGKVIAQSVENVDD